MNNEQGFKQIKRVSMTESVAEAIQSMISSGVFNPGDKLPTQKELEEMMNVSRPTLREAISRLIVSDIIEARQGQGYFVKEQEISMNINCPVSLNNFDKEKISELFEARLLFEASLTQLAAICATDDEAAKLLDYIERSEKNQLTEEEMKGQGNYFHKMIADFSHNLILSGFESSLLNLFNNYEAAFVSHKNAEYHYKYEIDPHRRIAEAICEHNPFKAYSESFKHIVQYTTDIGIREKYQQFIPYFDNL